MHWYHWIALGALVICLLAFSRHFFRLIRLGKPVDYSRKAGNVTGGIVYSFTSGMDPRNKESAFLHLPTYAAGIVFHLATFLALLIFVLMLAGGQLGNTPGLIASLICFSGALAGLVMLGKRMTNPKLRRLSNPDDYLSNLLVTFFQLFAGLSLWWQPMVPAYMILAAVMFLYMPVGKLKHAIYFFAARYHLGLFYGWRNVWPVKKA